MRRVRATGAVPVVLSPTPKSDLTDVPSCLSENIDDVPACTTPTPVAVNPQGFAAEQSAVEAAGGVYLDVTPWICTPETCAVVVGDLLVYRDDNHLTTTYASFLAPLVDAELQRTLATRG